MMVKVLLKNTSLNHEKMKKNTHQILQALFRTLVMLLRSKCSSNLEMSRTTFDLRGIQRRSNKLRKNGGCILPAQAIIRKNLPLTQVDKQKQRHLTKVKPVETVLMNSNRKVMDQKLKVHSKSSSLLSIWMREKFLRGTRFSSNS